MEKSYWNLKRILSLLVIGVLMLSQVASNAGETVEGTENLVGTQEITIDVSSQEPDVPTEGNGQSDTPFAPTDDSGSGSGTQEPSVDSTEGPTPVASETLTEEPTEEPTQVPTQEPTEEPTNEPIEEPTNTPFDETLVRIPESIGEFLGQKIQLSASKTLAQAGDSVTFSIRVPLQADQATMIRGLYLLIPVPDSVESVSSQETEPYVRSIVLSSRDGGKYVRIDFDDFEFEGDMTLTPAFSFAPFQASDENQSVTSVEAIAQTREDTEETEPGEGGLSISVYAQVWYTPGGGWGDHGAAYDSDSVTIRLEAASATADMLPAAPLSAEIEAISGSTVSGSIVLLLDDTAINSGDTLYGSIIFELSTSNPTVYEGLQIRIEIPSRLENAGFKIIGEPNFIQSHWAESGYIIVQLKDITITAQTDSYEFDFSCIPFANGVTDDGEEITITAALTQDGSILLDNETGYIIDSGKISAMAKMDWENLTKTTNTQVITFYKEDYIGQDNGIVLVYSRPIVYTITTKDNGYDTGNIFAKSMVITDTLVLPEGFSCYVHDVNAGTAEVVGVGEAADGKYTAFTITWILENEYENYTDNLSGGKVSHTIQANNLYADLDKVQWSNNSASDGNSSYPQITNSASGEVTACTDESTQQLGGNTVITSVQALDARMDKGTAAELLNAISKNAVTSVIVGADKPAVSWTISVPQNTSGYVLRDYKITDEDWDAPFVPSSVIIPSFTNGDGETDATVTWWDASGATQSMIITSGGGRVDVTGTVKIEISFGDAQPDFKLGGVITVAGYFDIAMGDYNIMQTETPYTNGAAVSYCFDKDDDLQRGYDEASVTWKLNNVAVDKTAYNGQDTTTVWPGQTIYYQVVVKNESTTDGLTPVYFWDSWDPYLQIAASGLGSNFKVYKLDEHGSITTEEIDGVVSYRNTAWGENGFTAYYSGSLPAGSALVVQYTAYVKSLEDIAAVWLSLNGTDTYADVNAVKAAILSGEIYITIGNEIESHHQGIDVLRDFETERDPGKYYVEIEKEEVLAQDATSAFYGIGDTVQFRISYVVSCPTASGSNNEFTGGVNDGFTLTDVLPAGVTFVRLVNSGGDGTIDYAGTIPGGDEETVTFKGTLPQGESDASGFIIIEVRLPAADAGGGMTEEEIKDTYYAKSVNQFTNRVDFYYEPDEECEYSTTRGEGTTYNGNHVLTTYASVYAREGEGVLLEVAKESLNAASGREAFNPGDTVYYTLTLENVSGTPVTVTSAVDYLPPHMVYTGYSGGEDGYLHAYCSAEPAFSATGPGAEIGDSYTIGFTFNAVTLGHGDKLSITFTAKISEEAFSYEDATATLVNKGGFYVTASNGETLNTIDNISNGRGAIDNSGGTALAFATDEITVEQKAIKPGIFKKAFSVRDAELDETSLNRNTYVHWCVGIINSKTDTTDAINTVVIEDALPEGFTYVNTGSYTPIAYLVSESTAKSITSANISGTNVTNQVSFAPSGNATSLTITYNGTIPSGQALVVLFWAKTPNTYGQYTNIATAYFPNNVFYDNLRDSVYPGRLVTNSGGNRGLQATASVFVYGTTGVQASKTVKGSNGQSASGGGTITVSPGEDVTFTLTYKNTGTNYLGRIAIIDKLPLYADSGVITGQWRESKFSLELLDVAVTITNGNNEKGISSSYYSTSTDFGRSPDYYNVNNGIWGNASKSNAMSVLIDLGDTILGQGDYVTVTITMRAPSIEDTGVTTLPLLETAWNSFAVQADVLTGPNHDSAVRIADFTIEPVKVGAELAFNKLGDYVWLDANGNGIQDGNEIGIPGVTVALYEVVDGVVGDTPVRTTATDDRGYYEFICLDQGKEYAVQFPPAITVDGIEYTLTIQHAGNDAAKDSDPDQATGYTGTISLGPTEMNLTIDAGYMLAEGQEIGYLRFTKQVKFMKAEGESRIDRGWPDGLELTFVVYQVDEITSDITFSKMITLNAQKQYFDLPLPTGTYTICEKLEDVTSYAGYSLTTVMTGNESLWENGEEMVEKEAEIEADKLTSLLFTNTYEQDTGKLTFMKALKILDAYGDVEDSAWPGDLVLTFQLEYPDGRLEDFKLTANETSKTWKNMLMGTYTITEIARSGFTADYYFAGVSGDATATLKEKGKEVEAAVHGDEGNDTSTMTNTYQRKTGNLEFRKYLRLQEAPSGFAYLGFGVDDVPSLRFTITGPKDWNPEKTIADNKLEKAVNTVITVEGTTYDGTNPSTLTFTLSVPGPANPSTAVYALIRLRDVPTGSYTITETSINTLDTYIADKYSGLYTRTSGVTTSTTVPHNTTGQTSLYNTYKRDAGNMRFTKEITVEYYDGENIRIATANYWPTGLEIDFCFEADGDIIGYDPAKFNALTRQSDGTYTFSLSQSHTTFELKDLPTGSYKITELERRWTYENSAGYTFADNEPQPLFVSIAKGDTVSVSMPNDFTRSLGSLEFTKNASVTDAVYKTTFPVMTFTLTTDTEDVVGGDYDLIHDGGNTALIATDKNNVYTYTLNLNEENSKTLTLVNLPTGSYTITEDIEGSIIAGYTLTTEGVTYGTVTTEGASLSIDNTYERDLGSLELTKAFSILDAHGNDAKWPTGTKAYFSIEGPLDWDASTSGIATVGGSLSEGPFFFNNSMSFAMDVTEGTTGTVSKTIKLTDLSTGTYTITEISSTALKFYTLETTYSVTDINGSSSVTNDSNALMTTLGKNASGDVVPVSVQIDNAYTHDTGNLSFIKTVEIVDAGDVSINWPEDLKITFAITEAPYDFDPGKYASEGINADGSFTLSRDRQSIALDGVPAGQYKIKEVSAGTPYQYPEYSLTVYDALDKDANITDDPEVIGTVEKDASVALTMHNVLNHGGRFVVTKSITGFVDANGTRFWPDWLELSFEFFDAEDNLFDTFTLSTTQPIYIIENIPAGTYMLRELAREGIVTCDPISVEIKYGEVIIKPVQNRRETTSVHINKYWEDKSLYRYRPETVTFVLTRAENINDSLVWDTGFETVYRLAVSTSGDYQQFSFDNLPVISERGYLYTYSVSESDLSDRYTANMTQNGDTFSFTNRLESQLLETPMPTPTATPTSTPTPTPTATPAVTPTRTRTVAPTATPKATEISIVSPNRTVTPGPTQVPNNPEALGEWMTSEEILAVNPDNPLYPKLYETIPDQGIPVGGMTSHKHLGDCFD